MVEREVEVLNRAGIHARPAALIVKVAKFILITTFHGKG